MKENCNNNCTRCKENIDGWCMRNDFSVFAHSNFSFKNNK